MQRTQLLFVNKGVKIIELFCTTRFLFKPLHYNQFIELDDKKNEQTIYP